MQDNMRAVADRELKLQGLEGQTENLQNASNTFAEGATKLKEKQERQKYMFYALIGLLISWVICFLFFRDHLVPFVVGTLLIAGLVFVAQKLLDRAKSGIYTVPAQRGGQLQRAPLE
eukprot:CAMPEP_0169130240 /NCGR_PEP_ID=MMETSP1015-20121227/37590_1 /TAXON_ID=342587 /ORGANISM="Karlodinium micrum, Strain CCMP2283" /LENGTH=116 /DNA_ID=CAMNT_0009194385 /DNA_START=166 /DNA_END=516 /DNA_ORIENTATION=+